jgi:hypothetical protein
MVVEARKLSDELKTTTNNNNTQEIQQVCQALDALGYEEAAQYVYGCDYQDWKKAHAKKATEEQMYVCIVFYYQTIEYNGRHDESHPPFINTLSWTGNDIMTANQTGPHMTRTCWQHEPKSQMHHPAAVESRHPIQTLKLPRRPPRHHHPYYCPMSVVKT